MGHEHTHNHGGGNIKVAFFLNLAFTIFEIIGVLEFHFLYSDCI